ncbi:hypothetical protein OESDEN_04385 [Oesophagostomum dentatum]|uniref:7TM GPCR serpentine receptor class x (Srx) domain-containing protein n=1 Tax=Oesophagostomum dentatum TaxID=61180 RepID=A0A0B1TEK3_OESDE|nr:hypothetical protein OESDEN_04385 [Oesophagostomum dentatum]
MLSYPFQVLGLCCAILNGLCFPNEVVLKCTNTIHSVTQLFSIICVNSFFLVVTIILALCNLCGVMDSFYKFNFPVIERKIYLLTIFMYIVSLIMVAAAISGSTFIFAWFLPLVFTLLTTITYTYDLTCRSDGSILAALCP